MIEGDMEIEGHVVNEILCPLRIGQAYVSNDMTLDVINGILDYLDWQQVIFRVRILVWIKEARINEWARRRREGRQISLLPMDDDQLN